MTKEIFRTKEEFINWAGATFWTDSYAIIRKEPRNEYKSYALTILMRHDELRAPKKLKFTCHELSTAQEILKNAKETGYCKCYTLERRRVIEHEGLKRDNIEYE